MGTIVPPTAAKLEKKARGRALTAGLSGDLKERLEGEKTIWISMKYRERPAVVLTGFWNGRLIKSAQNCIAKAYRQQRFKNLGNRDFGKQEVGKKLKVKKQEVEKGKGGTGDGK